MNMDCVRRPKSLIVYFSRKGSNYVGGRIVNLPIGNTEVIAEDEKGAGCFFLK